MTALATTIALGTTVAVATTADRVRSARGAHVRPRTAA